MAPNGSPGIKDGEPLYNSRLVKNYLEYVEKFYPEADIDGILNQSGISAYEIEDQGCWFSQQQVDRFREVLATKIAAPNLSREVGRYAAFSQASGAVRQYALGFMSPAAAYWISQTANAIWTLFITWILWSSTFFPAVIPPD